MTETQPGPPWPAEWMRGVLELCVLGALDAGPAHGYALAQRVEAAGLGAVKGGTLYPLLTRLEADGLVEASWQAGEGGPGRKVFSLTGSGAAESRRRASRWAEFARRAHTLLPLTTSHEPTLPTLTTTEAS